MAFLGQLGKRLSDAGQTVAQQTKNFADVAQLNSLISEAERTIAKKQEGLGQIYFEMYKDDETAEGAAVIAEIKALYAEIKNNQEKIKQIKGIIQCANCGAELPLNAVFCSSCGAKVEREESVEVAEETQAPTCPNCQAVVAEGNVFCTSCGTKLVEEEE